MTVVKFKPSFAKDFMRETIVPAGFMGAIDTLFNDQLAKFERNVFFTPKVDVLETPENYEIMMALPGVKKEAINIEIDGEALIVSGENKAKELKEQEQFHALENYYGKFSRTFSLPKTVNKGAIAADFELGMLKISLPKAEEKSTRSKVIVK